MFDSPLGTHPGIIVVRVPNALSTEEQAVVRACWTEKMAALAGTLRLDHKFAAERRPYVELDENGAVMRHDPEPAPTPGLRAEA